MVRRYRETCLNAYLNRRQRSLGYVYNGGMPGNIYSNPEIGTAILFQENWSFAGAGSDLIANLNPAKWSAGQYLAGTTNYQYDGAGNILGTQAVGPPAVKILSVPIVYNRDKAHSLLVENCGFVGPTSASAGQSNIAAGIEAANALAGNALSFLQITNGNAVDHSGALFQPNINGVTTTYTGLQYWAGLAGTTIKMIYGAWNGTNRNVWSYLNGVLIDHQVSTVRGLAANNCLKMIFGQGDHEGAPATTTGRITFRGFST